MAPRAVSVHQPLYDGIGRTYTSTRRPDPRIAAAIDAALQDAASIVNVGAGAGAYEPAGRRVVAVEPSRQMIRQRAADAAPAVQAVAEALPFSSARFDAALAVLTLHHWTNWRTGVAEMKRVARRVVVLAFDADALDSFWLTASYFPEIVDLDRRRSPSMGELVDALDGGDVTSVAVPHDCVDGFLAAYWQRPEAYLDSAVRASISAFALLSRSVVERGVARLAADLASGRWDERFGHLRSLDAIDAGYRLLASGAMRR